MNLYQVGNLAKSIAGHDKDQFYVIVREESEYVYLADGKERTLERPKRKNKKHIQPIYYDTEKKEPAPEMKRNEEIKRAIKLFSAKAAQE